MRPPLQRLRASTAVGLVAMALAAGVASGEAATPSASLPDIEDEVMCTICGTLLELSESPQADRERELIRRLIAAGKTKQQIKDALVAEYGEQVLATPRSSGFDLAAWLVPALGLMLAAVGIAIGWRRVRGRAALAAPRDQPPLDPEDNRRIDADLAREDP